MSYQRHSRKCIRCQQVQQIVEFDKHQRACKTCRQKQHDAKYQPCIRCGEPTPRRWRRSKMCLACRDSGPAGHKRCSICWEVKPLDEFYQDPNSNGLYGYQALCKECKCGGMREQRRVAAEAKLLTESDEWCVEKPCAQCGEVKSIMEFLRNKIQRYGRICYDCRVA